MSDTSNDNNQPLKASEALEALEQLRDEAVQIGDVHTDDQDEP